jgi:hypothetical protein
MEEEEEKLLSFQLHDVAVRKGAILTGGFFLFMCVIQLCFICRSSDSIVSEDAGIEPASDFSYDS